MKRTGDGRAASRGVPARALAAVALAALAAMIMPAPAALGYPAMDFVKAARENDVHAVRNLLEADPELVKATDEIGFTALDWAATRGHARIVGMLLAAGAAVDVVGWDGGTVLHRACHHRDPGLARMLLDAGADLAVRNQWGRTPLHVAARRGCLEVARLLLARGADPNVGTKEGWTPLHVAQKAGWPEMVDLLLAHGADPAREDEEGRRPEDHAFTRPAAIAVDPAILDEYVGLYDLGHGLGVKVWWEGEGLMIREFAPDTLYPVGADEFHCGQEPWRVRFVRDEGGAVAAVELAFLRRTVRAERLARPRYVGSAACRECHLPRERGGQYVQWLQSRHALAYWHLATDWAMFLAKLRPYYQDLVDCRGDDRCLMCHTTAAQDDDALLAADFDAGEGVGCETCHGPGSDYMDPEIMSDRERFLAAGGIVPDEATCRRCHRNDQFVFAEFWPRVAHPLPDGEGAQESH
jgi:nitrate/TMAO reductase-like tetraheme cytochrome c subunit